MSEWWDWERYLDPSGVTDDAIIFTLEYGLERVQQGWCQGNNSVDSQGRITWPDSPDSCSWCATGAILAVHPNCYGIAQRSQYLTNLHRDCFEILAIPLPRLEDVHPEEWSFQGLISGWNDTPGRTLEEVVDLYEQALVFSNDPPPPAVIPKTPTGVVPSSEEAMAMWVGMMGGGVPPMMP